METTTCNHQEKIDPIGGGVELGTCSLCNQIRRYETDEAGKRRMKVIKLGKIDGKLVAPNNKDKLDLSSQETDELGTAEKPASKPPEPVHTDAAVITPPAEETADTVQKAEEQVSLPAESAEPEQPAQPPPKAGVKSPKTKGKKKFKKCKQCESHTIIDEKDRCTSLRCPRRYKQNMRPPYYAPEAEKPVVKRTYKLRTPKVEAHRPNTPTLAPYPTFDADGKWASEVCIAWLENYPKVLEIQNNGVALKAVREELIKTFREDFSKFLTDLEKAPQKKRGVFGFLNRCFKRH